MNKLALTRGDYLIITLALILVGFSYHYFWHSMLYAQQVEIRVHGKHWGSFDLYQNQDIKVSGRLGVSQLQIKDGKIRFIASPCTAKLCIQQGWLQHSGEVAACLPNEVTAHILGEDPRYDSINF